ncbi:MAG: hypothetical protein KJP06_07600 [Deltaproteobacteria bacterium]|nr:hypothetical protein [Deltaproteobacteria bacterium]
MPVLTTIIISSFVFSRSKDKASFLKPSGLRAKLERLPEGLVRIRAIALADKLDELSKAYDDATEAAIRNYTLDAEEWTSTPDQLDEDFEQLDRIRDKVYQGIVVVRQALIDLLTPEEWDQVFD